MKQSGTWNPNDPSTWPPALDALIAAPEHHKLIFENDSVRVIETRIPAGETTRVHTHCWPAVLNTLSSSDIVRRDDRGTVIYDSRTTSSDSPAAPIKWSAPFPPHTLENVGQREVRVIAVEIKRA